MEVEKTSIKFYPRSEKYQSTEKTKPPRKAVAAKSLGFSRGIYQDQRKSCFVQDEISDEYGCGRLQRRSPELR